MTGEPRPALLVLDTSYTLEIIRERGLENSVLCRDLDGFFRHVWSVHPFASLLTSDAWAAPYGRAEAHAMSDRHTFVEGKMGRFKWLKRIFPVNFVLSQAMLFLELRRLIKQEKIGAIRVGDPLYLGLFGLGLSRLTGVPMLIRVNGHNERIRQSTGTPAFPRLFRTMKRERKIERFVFPRADMVAALNEENRQFALDNGVDPARTTLFPVGNLLAPEHLTEPDERAIDEALFARLGLRPGRYLLSVARLQPSKFPDDILEAFAHVHAAGHDIDLAYAGDGDMREALQVRADALGVAQKVRFIGNQNQVSLARLNCHAAAVVSPLTGRALSESALGAAPIVAYDLDWQGDLIRTGETGELVPFRNPELLGASIVKYLENPDYARAMGRAVRARALEMLDPERLNEHERTEYARMMASKARKER